MVSAEAWMLSEASAIKRNAMLLAARGARRHADAVKRLRLSRSAAANVLNFVESNANYDRRRRLKVGDKLVCGFVTNTNVPGKHHVQHQFENTLLFEEGAPHPVRGARVAGLSAEGA